MKLLLKLTFVLMPLFSPILVSSQHDSEKMSECKALTIRMFKGENLQQQLSDCIVSLALESSESATAYTNWAKNLAHNSTEKMDEELRFLNERKQASKTLKQQSLNTMINDVSNHINSSLVVPAKKRNENSIQGKCPYNSDGDPTTVCTQR